MSRVSVFGLALLSGSAVCASPATSWADRLHTDPQLREEGFVPIEELSHEVLITPVAGYTAEVKIRMAFHNNGERPHDAIMTVGLPRSAELLGMAIARDGNWIEAESALQNDGVGQRAPGSAFARILPPDRSGDIPGAEISMFGLDPATTTQVELRLSVVPEHREDRWRIELPHRGSLGTALNSERRILVRGLPAGHGFWVGDVSNEGAPVLSSLSEDGVEVSWPGSSAGSAILDGRFEYAADRTGQGGVMRLVMRLGETRPLRPDHVIFAIDRSRSLSSAQRDSACHAIVGLLAGLPGSTSFEAFAFDRSVTDLTGTQRLFARDAKARERLAKTCRHRDARPGTDLPLAMQEAGSRVRARSAHRPLVLVLTDGVLPVSATPIAVDAALRAGLLRTRRPDLLLWVDDPVLAAAVSPAEHAVASVASRLGARIRFESFSTGAGLGADHLLASPRLLGDLAIDLPERVTLLDDLPSGLVAGDVAIVEASYRGRVPSNVAIRGKMGHRNVVRRLAAKRRAEPPLALVASLEGPTALARLGEEGFSVPSWYTRKARYEARLDIAQSGRTGDDGAGFLDGPLVHRYLRMRVLPRARACFNHALGRNQVQGGRVVLAMEIAKGEVMSAKVSSAELIAADSLLNACLEEAAWALDPPAGKRDGVVYRIEYPLQLNPPKGGVAPSTSEVADPLFERLIEDAAILSR